MTSTTPTTPQELITAILARRGITEEQHEQFFHPRYEDTYDPWLLNDMEAAVTRIAGAIEDGERIVIYGDYDIDGLSATTLLLDGLKQLGARVNAYIPDRFEEGYGLNAAALSKVQAEGADLVITVDCGSVSFAPLEQAAAAGLDVIVTDHHEPYTQLPPAQAVINPKRADSTYPFRELAGVGVAFKLMQALQQQLPGLSPGQEKWLLDLVALGTVCDVVPLRDENRVLVTYGLKTARRSRRAGIKSLADVGGVALAELQPHHFGFVLGPRLNAAGRLEHARTALEVLTAADQASATASAEQLDALNTQRRQQQDSIYEQALTQAQDYIDDPVLVLSHPEWSHGIVGIVASKLVERLQKPTVLLQELEDRAKGSARSLGGFDMVDAFRAADDVLDVYGGHQVAAGCSLAVDAIPQLRQRLLTYYQQQGFDGLATQLEPDATVSDMELLNEQTYQLLEGMAPFGMGNPRPLLHIPEVKVGSARQVGNDQDHLKLSVSDGRQHLDAIGFGLGHRLQEIGEQVSLWFELDKNHYNGRSQLQLKLKELA